jgi:vitamin K-dependent gamma-carboxylase
MSERLPPISNLRRLALWFNEPVDPASVAVFRMLAYQVVRHLTRGYLLRFSTVSDYQFHYYGFGWVRVLEPELMLLLFLAIGFSAFLLAIGFLYRLAAPVFFLTVGYWFLLDQVEYLNHMYLVVLYGFLLCLVPAHRYWSCDALVFRSSNNGVMPRWGLWVLRFQMGCVYFFGAVAKINRDWLIDAEPVRTWVIYNNAKPLAIKLLSWDGAAHFLSWSGFLIDLLAVPFLLWKRTRLAMFLVLVAFHLSNKYLFHIGIFPWLSLAATSLFLPPSWPRTILRLPRFTIPTVVHRPSAFVIPAILVPYVLLQLFLPLRHHLYPGDVAWTEEGHRFAWRMKLRSKVSEGYFLVQTRDMSHMEVIKAESLLHRRQVRQVLGRPDMVLQMAHILAAEEEARLGKPVQVFANVKSQLNHHQPQLLIDPTVDLAAEPRNLWHADWIMPFERSPIRYWENRPPPQLEEE